jgi:hypothetical protein
LDAGPPASLEAQAAEAAALGAAQWDGEERNGAAANPEFLRLPLIFRPDLRPTHGKQPARGKQEILDDRK